MYETYYNLACSPFANTSNTRFFFGTVQNKEVLAKLDAKVTKVPLKVE